jgi:tetratricopeptide (TPR) repeat protein
MFCTSCGTRNSDGGNYCKQCGHKLDKPTSTRISEAAYEKALPEDEQVTALLERAYKARKNGDRETAIALCQDALAVRPDSTACHSLLGQLHEQGGDIELAISEYEQVLILNPGSIADRVKLDELRGEVPALVTSEVAAHTVRTDTAVAPRPVPHIVVADSSKAPEISRQPVDLRVPAYTMGAVGLVVLGAIAAMLMIQHQSGSRNNTPLHASGNPQIASVPPVNGGQQTNQNSTAPPANNGSSLTQQQTSPFESTFTGLGSNTPVVIQQKPPADNAPRIIYQTIPGTIVQPGEGGLPNLTRNGSTQQTTDAGEPDIPNKGVHVANLGGGTIGTPNNAGRSVGSSGINAVPSPAPPANNYVRPSAGQDSNTSTGASETTSSAGAANSNSQKKMALADTAALQGNYKVAGNLYIQALDGAGDDTAYIYRRAGWCFEKAGEKTTALNYYQHGIDEAQKLVKAGRQVENARSLIRACETGIKVCSN